MIIRCDPISKYGRDLVQKHGDDTPIEWISRDQRYNEKLATPDVSIADLIGDIDPIKAATNRLNYAHEGVIHFGIIPRTNRGIFVINELPDLQPRIQVGLLNILEEQDLQIRGYPAAYSARYYYCFFGKSGRLYKPRKYYYTAKRPNRFPNYYPLSPDN